jgi:hypothetical protein
VLWASRMQPLSPSTSLLLQFLQYQRLEFCIFSSFNVIVWLVVEGSVIAAVGIVRSCMGETVLVR